jgi:zeta-carotene desaturase
MGCYEDTIKFLKKIGSYINLIVQDSLEIEFVHPGGIVHKLKSPKRFYPFNLLIGILNYKAITFKERLKVIDFFLDLACCCDEDIKNITVEEWLNEKGQSPQIKKALWEILVVGALNTDLKNASAGSFAQILKRIFLDGPHASKIIIPKSGLTELYVEQSRKYIEHRSGRISNSERVLKFIVNNKKIIKVISDKSEYTNFDSIICAIPPHALSKIEIENENGNTDAEFERLKNLLKEIKYSEILNVHLWLKENPFKNKFYGLIDSKIHWLFNHGKHISLTTSNSGAISKASNEEIVSEFNSELEKYFPIFKCDLITNSKIIKEKRATFIPDTHSNILRAKVFSPFENLIFAGDWIDTGLPSTIESAVLSGRIAAEKFLKFIYGDTY